MYSEVPVPKSLESGKSFDFLRRDLRRTGLVSSASGYDGGSLHGGGFGGGGGYGGGGGVPSPGLPPGGGHGGSGLSGHFGGG
jgi:hypothetical protein